MSVYKELEKYLKNVTYDKYGTNSDNPILIKGLLIPCTESDIPDIHALVLIEKILIKNGWPLTVKCTRNTDIASKNLAIDITCNSIEYYGIGSLACAIQDLDTKSKKYNDTETMKLVKQIKIWINNHSNEIVYKDI